MTAITAHQLLTILAWFLLAILLAFLLLIARFYENVSNERTHFWMFVLPVIVFGLASARYAFINQLGGDLLGDGLWFVGGVILAGLCVYLYKLMTSGR